MIDFKKKSHIKNIGMAVVLFYSCISMAQDTGALFVKMTSLAQSTEDNVRTYTNKGASAESNENYATACMNFNSAVAEIDSFPNKLKELHAQEYKKNPKNLFTADEFKKLFVDEASEKIAQPRRSLIERRANVCGIAKDRFIQKGKCVAYKATRYSCASAGNVWSCLSIRWGADYQLYENSCD